MFSSFVGLIIDLEGGDKVHSLPNDPGGLTKYGISQKAYPDLDIKSITYDQASEIYFKDYWEKYRIYELSYPLALCVFDSAVNQGPGTAIRLLQRALGVKEDGILGPKTVQSANEKDQAELVINYLSHRAMHYSRLGTFSSFGRGWIVRLFKIHQAIWKGLPLQIPKQS